MGTKKNFVIDTNVILHDYNCLKNFQENDIYLPDTYRRDKWKRFLFAYDRCRATSRGL